MTNPWTRLSNCGMQFAKTTQDRKAVPLINRMTFVLTMLMLVFSVVGLVMGLGDILYFSIPFSVIFGLTPVIQDRGWLKFARYYFSFSPLLCVAAICFYNSAAMGDKFFFFATALAPMIVMRKRSEMIIIFLMSAIAFYFINWWQAHHEPVKKIPADLEYYYFILSISCLFIILFFIVQYFGKGNAEYESELEVKNAEISEKNKDILDSIRYARRIQHALMASKKTLDRNLAEYFILYKPKDVVSGDFYWAEEMKDGKFMLLTGDCTGHGVPGAFMSLLNISIINEITTRMNITSPEAVLNTQRDAIIMSLNPEGAAEVAKDGMDCVLCSFDFKNKKIQFAGANNPVWILRNGGMMEFKGDKQPIGVHQGPDQKYTLHSVDLLPGDVVYTFTDGFADQFGGERGKKYKYKKLEEKLVSIGKMSMSEQSAALDKEFMDWKGNYEQLDDVLIIGVQIK